VHDAAGFIRGSLARIRDVMSTIGLRATAGCAIGGGLAGDALAAAMEESRDAATFGRDGRSAFVFGAGELAAIPDAQLEDLAAIAARGETPIHATVGHGGDAAAEVARLRKAGLLRRNSVLLLLEPLPEAEREALAGEGVVVVRSPSAEALAGKAPARLDPRKGPAALGTDAGRPDLFEEARTAYARARSAGEDVTPADAVALLAGGARLASEIFRTPMGSFEPGSAADLLVLDYRPAVPLNPETVCHHVLFGISTAFVQHVMVDGRMVILDRTPVNVDVRNLFRQTQRGALDLWQRMHGAPFPGLGTPMKSVAASEAEPRDRGAPVRRFDEEDVELEPLAQPPEALKPWLVCKPQDEEPAPAAAPAPPRLPEPASAAPGSRNARGFGDGIV
jgi:cytosine/adenosine deaminase-related metal-dependent hydrolase